MKTQLTLLAALLAFAAAGAPADAAAVALKGGQTGAGTIVGSAGKSSLRSKADLVKAAQLKKGDLLKEGRRTVPNLGQLKRTKGRAGR